MNECEVCCFAKPEPRASFTDTDQSELEDGSRTYGVSNKERLLVVVHTRRRNGILIISAPEAT